MARNEEGRGRLHRLMPKMLAGQGGASTSHRIIATLTYSRMEMGDDLHGFQHGFSHDDLTT